jgi:hypothetical protein
MTAHAKQSHSLGADGSLPELVSDFSQEPGSAATACQQLDTRLEVSRAEK